jgi:hypothetical protein
VWVAVSELGLREQRVSGGEFFQDGEIRGRGFLRGKVFHRFERGEADEVGGDFAVVEVAAVVADGAVDLEAVLYAGEIVFAAVARGCVNGTGAGIGRDVLGSYNA